MRIIILFFIACSSDSKVISDDGLVSDLVDESHDADGDGFIHSEDCDDTDPEVYSGAEEICDGVDNNCDGEIDEGLLTDFYLDADGDGYGTQDDIILECSALEGYVEQNGDCDDDDDAIHPQAPEQCDELDNDCDGSIDEEVVTIWYADTDGDGFGDLDVTEANCIQPEGYVENSDDCDDDDDAIYPEAPELCDELDNDCDGDIDEEVASIWYLDDDLDYFGDPNNSILACSQPEGYTSMWGDCDDTDSFSYPGAIEFCDYVDNNCDGNIDEGSAVDASVWYADADADSFGDPTQTMNACELPSGYVADNTDCDDTRADSNPNAQEYCDGHDDNCDGVIDEDSAIDSQDWFLDDDGDGFGVVSTTLHQCAQPGGYVLDNTDCDDARLETNPGAQEYCNSIDDNCNGSIDDGAAADALIWYQDVDEDGFGDPNISLARCVQPSGYVSDNTDCDDELVTSNPSALEYCNGVDDDCDGTTDEQGAIGMGTYYVDADGDGYGSSSSVNLCSVTSGYSSSNDDCNDGNSGISPGASEICGNTTDENCNGQYSESCPQTYYGCGGPGALQPGSTISCSFGGTRYVDQVRVSGGCNDGESGTYTFSFSDGSSVTVSGGCNSVHSITPRFASSATLYMNSGGGGDGNISWTCCGSSGWGIYYR